MLSKHDFFVSYFRFHESAFGQKRIGVLIFYFGVSVSEKGYWLPRTGNGMDYLFGLQQFEKVGTKVFGILLSRGQQGESGNRKSESELLPCNASDPQKYKQYS